MRTRLIATVFCLATLLPLAGHAGDGTGTCRFANEQVRQKTAAQSGALSTGMVALDRGDVEAAQAIFDRALAERPGDTGLIIFIAGFYREGTCGLPKNLAKVAAIYRNGAARGDAGSMLNLALMLWHGEGAPQDRAAAIHLFRQGAIAFGIVGGKPAADELDGLADGPFPPELVDELDWVKEFVTVPGMGRAVADELLNAPAPNAVFACRYLLESFDILPDADTAYLLSMMHLEGREIFTSLFHGFLYLHYAAIKSHPAANAEIGRRIMRGDIRAREEWEGLAWLMRAQRLGGQVKEEVEEAKRNLSAYAIKEAEIQAKLLPNLATPPPDNSQRCIAN
ncbi:MAG: sel1 repeat family protein [Rhodospirillaceae bacterium]|nr:sel1 repeat family protein [Rhodospirillales bacterium]